MTTKNILITGVHTGLGNGLAQVYSREGHRVFGVSRREPDNLAGHSNFTFCSLDISAHYMIDNTLTQLLSGISKLDVVILNAGILGDIKHLKDTPLHEMQNVMDINVWANKYIIDCVCQMPEPPEQIIAISSGAAFLGSGGWGSYCVSKSALNLLIRVYANEHPHTHFVSLAPGLVNTPIINSILNRPPNPDFDADGRIRTAAAEGRVIPPIQVAERIIQIEQRLKTLTSGDYVDIRELPWETDSTT